MTIVHNDDDVVCCITDGCKQAFDSLHGWKIHYGQQHKKKTTECVRCGEEFADRHAGQKSQCLECVKKHGRLAKGTLASAD